MSRPDLLHSPGDGALVIRPLRRPEMVLALDWAAAEGWNPGLGDADPFHAADPQGFLLGLLDDEPVALISAVRSGADTGFIGFYIVRPAWRGQGHGWTIWQAALRQLAGRNIGLDGVLAQQANYRRSGFQLAWRNIRFQGSGGDGEEAVPLESWSTPGGEVALLPLDRVPVPLLIEYDRAFFPADRSAFLHRWIAQPSARGFAMLQGDRLQGYGVVRTCRSGHKIGPLFADTPQVAEALFLALRAGVPAGEPLFLDVPECQPQALALAQRHAMQPMFETARMYTGPVPDISIARTYGITSFELG